MVINALAIADRASFTNTQRDSWKPRPTEQMLVSPLQAIPVPMPRHLVRRRMHEVAKLIGGPVEALAIGEDVERPNSLHLQMANLIIMGTACSRPLLQEEATNVSKITNHAILVVRLELDPSITEGLAFDFLGGPEETWIDRALLWQDPTRHGLWLVPSEGEGRSARLSALSREMISRAPFYSLGERTAGIERAASSMRALRDAR